MPQVAPELNPQITKTRTNSKASIREAPAKQGTKSRTATWGWPRLVPTPERRESYTKPTVDTLSANKDQNLPISKETTVTQDNIMAEVREATEVEGGRKASSDDSNQTTKHHTPPSDDNNTVATVDGGAQVDSSVSQTKEQGDTTLRPGVSGVDAAVQEADKALDDKSTSDAAVSSEGTFVQASKAATSPPEVEPIVDKVPSRRTSNGIASLVRESESNLSKSSSRRRISIAEPLPLPKIHVQHPSDTSDIREVKVKTPPPASETIDTRLADERKQAFEAAKMKIAQDIAADASKKVTGAVPTPIADATAVPPRILRPRKSQMALRKTRNVLLRETFLKVLLGRVLAGPTKTILRKSAAGDLLSTADVSANVTGSTSATLSKAQAPKVV